MISLLAVAFVVTQTAQMPDGTKLPMGWCGAKPAIPAGARFIGKPRTSITPCGHHPVTSGSPVGRHPVRRAPLVQEREV